MNLSGSSVHGILQARILEWVAMPPSRWSFWLRDPTHVSYISCIGGQVLPPLAPPGKSITIYMDVSIHRHIHMYTHTHTHTRLCRQPSQVALVVKNLPTNSGDLGDMGSILGSRVSPGSGHGNQLQYSCLENPMDRGAWWATVYSVTRHGVIIQSIESQVVNTTEAT